MAIFGRDAATGRKWLDEPYLNLGSSGGSRVDTSKDNPEPKLPPLGFTSREAWDEALVESDIEPLVWEGD